MGANPSYSPKTSFINKLGMNRTNATFKYAEVLGPGESTLGQHAVVLQYTGRNPDVGYTYAMLSVKCQLNKSTLSQTKKTLPYSSSSVPLLSPSDHSLSCVISQPSSEQKQNLKAENPFVEHSKIHGHCFYYLSFNFSTLGEKLFHRNPDFLHSAGNLSITSL